MRNKREADPDFFDMLVDVKTWSTVVSSERTTPWPCRVTPKRIYTPGGAMFDRSTGRQLIARKHMGSPEYRRRALVETIRPAKGAA